MIDIYDTTGNLLLSPPTLEDAERVEELMVSDYAQLAWQSDSGETLPAGAYIMLNGEKLTLLNPYEPEQKDEAEWSYRPQFQSRVMGWGKVPFFHYTYSSPNTISAREPDWTLTDTPANFMAAVCRAIKNETGETWTYEVAADIIAASATISFTSTDIYSGLNNISSVFETEWRADKQTNTLYLGKAEYGTAIMLQVDSNVGVPSVTKSKEDYYNRFFVFGSTRNITQDYQGANVNGLVNKRLTLDPTKFPGGYIDVPRAAGIPIFPKILTFDDIYPHSGLTVSDLRPRLMYRLDTDGNKVQVGTDAQGNPVYDMYSIWYFQLPGFTLNDSTYSKDNPSGMLISGKSLSIHFKTGALTNREFELIYHPKAETLHNSDGQDFQVKKGDYEIKFVEESSLIIPMQTGIVPADGDEVILFNIRMPQEYVATAYAELEQAALKEIAERYTSDLNNYTLKSNPVAFAENDPGLSLGRRVTYVNGDYSYTTRVIKLVSKLDVPSEQEITIGNEKIKGNSATLKEEVVNANTSIDLLTQLNQLTQNVAQAYQRTQQLMLDGFARIGRMWEFDPDDPDVIYTRYNFYGKGWGSVLGKNPNAGDGTLTAGATTLGGLSNVVLAADEVQAADKVLVREMGASGWSLRNLSDLVGLDTAALQQYLVANHYAKLSDIPSMSNYATQQWVNQQGFLKSASLADYVTKTEAAATYQPIGDYASVSSLNSAVSSLNTAISGKLDASVFDELFEKVTLASGKVAIKAKYGLYSESFMSCLGANPDAGSVVGGGVDLDAVQSYLTQQGYATQQWVNQQGFLKSVSLADYVTLSTTQTITGVKTFKGLLTLGEIGAGGPTAPNIVTKNMLCVHPASHTGGPWYLNSYDDASDAYLRWNYGTAEKIAFDSRGRLFTNAFIKRGGTSSQFLKADGSVDSNNYALASSLDNYVTKSTDQEITGMKTFKSGFNIKFNTDSNNALGISWVATNGVTVKQSIIAWNAANKIFLNPNGSEDTWSDAKGKYSLVVGENLLTYNTYNVLHSGNYASILDNSYVKKSGDTMTGQLIMTNTSDRVIRMTMKQNGGQASGIHWYDATGYITGIGCYADMSNGIASSDFLFIGWGASPWSPTNNLAVAADRFTYKNKAIWHEGNDGSGSGLDADLLDGFHASSFYQQKNIRSDQNSIYDLRFNFGTTDRDDYHGTYEAEYPSAYGPYLSLAYANKNQAAILWFNSGFTDTGRVYVNVRKAGDGNTQYSGWKSLAFLTDNVASATKLANTRTIWGQNFNGENNVSGNMTGVGSITASDNIDISSSTEKHVKITVGDYSVGLDVALSGNKGIWDWTAGGWLIASNANNNTIINVGNVGFGMSSPQCKVDVNGVVRSNSYFVREGVTGYSWNKGAGAYGVTITDNGAQTPLLVAYRAGQSAASEGRNRLFAMELLNSGTMLYFGFGGSMKFRMKSDGEFYAAKGAYSDGYISCLGKNDGSDIRLKSNFSPLTLSIETILNAPCGTFVWNGHAGDVMCGRRAVGTIAQYWLDPLPEVVGVMPTGYYGVNYGTLDWVAIHSVAKFAYNGITDHERRLRIVEKVALEENTMLKKENGMLRKENSDLKNYIAKLEGRNVA